MECQHCGGNMDSKNLATSELTMKTQIYWAVSKVFHTGQGISLTTTRAIHSCVDMIDNLGPHRALRRRVATLQERIIQGKKKKSKQPSATITILKVAP